MAGDRQAGLWVEGAILAQNPYDTDIYEQGDEPQVLFARSRLRVMASVLQALGARGFLIRGGRQEARRHTSSR